MNVCNSHMSLTYIQVSTTRPATCSSPSSSRGMCVSFHTGYGSVLWLFIISFSVRFYCIDLVLANIYCLSIIFNVLQPLQPRHFPVSPQGWRARNGREHRRWRPGTYHDTITYDTATVMIHIFWPTAFLFTTLLMIPLGSYVRLCH